MRDAVAVKRNLRILRKSRPVTLPLSATSFSGRARRLRCRPIVCPVRHIVIGKYFYRVYRAS